MPAEQTERLSSLLAYEAEEKDYDALEQPDRRQVSSALADEAEKEEAGCSELRWRCQVMPDRQVLRLVIPGRQVLRTTDPPRTSSYVGWWYLAAWRCGVSVTTATCSAVCTQGGGAVGRCGGVDDSWTEQD